MATYRLYYCDGDGKRLDADEFQAASDKDAIERARAIIGGRPPNFEVWYRDRLVHRAPADSLHGVYRLYLRGAEGILGRHDFEAENDDSALALGRLLWEACSDVSQSFELWQGSRRVDQPQSRPMRPAVSAASIAEKVQRLAIEHEETPSNGTWAIARSRCLMERLDELRRAHPLSLNE